MAGIKYVMLALAISACLSGCDHPFESHSEKVMRELDESSARLNADMVRQLTEELSQEHPEIGDYALHNAITLHYKGEFEGADETNRPRKCIDAKMVAEAYLQAGNSAVSAQWKEIAKRYCAHQENAILPPATTPSPKSEAQIAKEKVLHEALDQYPVSERAQDWHQMCVGAGTIEEAYRDLHQEVNYQYWKDLQGMRCRTANLLQK